ncbi:MAG: cobyric acid synthase [Clostridiaceae bacterium]
MTSRIMILGTASGAGKSTVAAGIIRALTNRGYSVCPYKSQNMSLNSHIDINGGEMGRAQVLQAECANIEPMAWMNPILLKPLGDTRSQVIFMGKPIKNMTAKEYEAYKPDLKGILLDDFIKKTSEYDIVVIEGAGSPAEINLRTNDIVNMGFAELSDTDAILVGDIDKGGVFAALYGTVMLLSEKERKRIKGFIINKFRGDVDILRPGIEMMEKMLNIPCLGIIPYERFRLEEEDGAIELNKKVKGPIDIAVIHLPHISNFTDFDALDKEEDVTVRYVDSPEELQSPDLLIIPGTKNTIGDLIHIKNNGLFKKIQDYASGMEDNRHRIIGICGGYQMLLDEIRDPLKVEGDIPMEKGLSILSGVTEMGETKIQWRTKGTALFNGQKHLVEGYEIHAGKTETKENHFIEKSDAFDGAKSIDEKIIGTYFHGIFDEVGFRNELLNEVRKDKGMELKVSPDFKELKIKEMDRLGQLMEDSLDMDMIIKIAGRL